MSKGALVVAMANMASGAAQTWRDRFAQLLPGRTVMLADAVKDRDAIRYAAVWKPKPGAVADFPKLAAIFNLGAGVDALLADASLPNIPLVRVANDDLTGRMTEYVVLHVLMHHRRQRFLDQCQRDKKWAPPVQWAAHAVRVGILGMGVLGRDAAAVLKRIGFRVAGWSQTRKAMQGVETFGGEEGLAPFLNRTDILVCLLPLTAQTRAILNRRTFAMLARDGVLGGPVLINAGRGGQQVEVDILAALDDGTLAGATLDVFEREPLPQDSPLWSHPKVTVTPHNAADSDPDEICRYVVDQIERFERGLPLENVIDRKRGY